MKYKTGTYYEIPEGTTWELLAAARRNWGIDPKKAPLAIAPGAIAWGTIFPSEYKNINGKEIANA